MSMKFGVVVFPGSNCDHDCYHVLKHVLGQPTEFVWHKDSDVARFDCLVLPGGFSYGDYLRTGAIARFSPVMDGVSKHAERGKLVLGICNGFQILTEAGLLPGALIRNDALKFVCKFVHVRVENTDTPFTQRVRVGAGLACLPARQVPALGRPQGAPLRMPIAHGEGNYFVDQATLADLKKNKQILFRYCDARGHVTDDANPNGSLENIAGICNKNRNVFGMMPHPERCSEGELGSVDGLKIFRSIISSS